MKDDVFDPSDSKYKTCCGVCHVTTGTILMCFVLLFVYVISLSFRIAFFPYPAFIFGGIILIIINILIIGLAIYAVKKEKPSLLIPLLIALFIPLILKTIETLYSLYTFSTYNQQIRTTASNNNNDTFYHQKQHSSKDELEITSLLIELLIYFVIQTWLFFIAYKCYKYLKAKKAAEQFDSFSRPDYRY
uniref:Uncharacterized protein n=1 Tax=Panagrolaimus davidi TaxID=227884 RepID=A0A914QVS7_9BILA